MTGTIARVALDKGFGWIRGDDGHEYWFARTMIAGGLFEMLREEQPVEFEADERGAKGLRARVVRVGPGRADSEGVSHAAVMKRHGAPRRKVRA